VRCDHALAAGTEVPAWYDSMVAKLVVHAPTRAQCVEQLVHALDSTVLLGVQTNRTFLARLLRHDSFRDGLDVSTAFIARHFAAAESRQSPPDAREWALAAWLSVAGAPEVECTPSDWRHWSTARPLPQPWHLKWHAPAVFADAPSALRGRLYLTPCSARVEHELDARAVQRVAATAGQRAHAIVDGERLDYRYAWSGQTLWIHTPRGDFAFDCLRRDPAKAGDTVGLDATEVRATINGRVLDVLATPGASVAQGDRLVVLEAMKMEHEVRAARAGRIAWVGVAAGEQVVPGQALVRYEGEPA
jgi:geranyl-CoA carboxylase alpha subunit